MPVPPGGDEPDNWSAVLDEAGEDRAAYEQALRLTWEHDDGYDPLLSEIAAARDAMLLIAYSREFTRPRPYRLEDPGPGRRHVNLRDPHRLRR